MSDRVSGARCSESVRENVQALADFTRRGMVAAFEQMGVTVEVNLTLNVLSVDPSLADVDPEETDEAPSNVVRLFPPA